ncbi:nicotinamide mononucleotide transporter [Wenyingzhuangia heitensis]|uniref:Nicotinamide riboside transporter PnuC n=1 Tax=Wenyingzhuangia heitensis TaxID=1487859 RepID=A0ABX0U431_9FLAO|nr:nicotinamide riboside transporter PnuC [Wenyingzhuangia heitensis]NIJ43627.1 nicotinamide mononucleotide transporter [Wenyingzhuangia heitensis]
MNHFFNFLFSQYADYQTLDISLEIIAVFFGLTSVVFSKKNHLYVFPTGMISTAIFVYLLFKWQLLGDMLINAYYFIMSIYGWYIWSYKSNTSDETPISRTTSLEKKKSIVIFLATLVFVFTVYTVFNKWTHWTAYVDTVTTAIFFVGMWLMAKRKIENWIYWIVGDLISIPLYFYKGFTFTSFQYLIFTLLAISGYLTWKKHLNNSHQTL